MSPAPPPRPPVPPALEHARAVIPLLEKVAKFVDLYGPTNAAVARVSDEVVRMHAAAGKGEDLELGVRNQTFYVRTDDEDEVVYDNPDPHRSLALALYRDGVRRLVLHSDLQAAELVDLVRLLRVDYAGMAEESVVTALWERGFRTLSYLAIEDYFGEDPADEVFDAEPLRERGRSRTQGTSTMALPEAAQAALAQDAGQVEQDRNRAGALHLTDTDRTQLLAELREPPEATAQRLLSAWIALVRQAADEAAVEVALSAIGPLFQSVLAQRQPLSAYVFLRGLDGAAESLAYGAPAGRAQRVAQALAGLRGPLALAPVVRGLADPAMRLASVLLLRQLGAAATPGLTKQLSTHPDALVRAILARLLERAHDPAAVLQALDELKPPPLELLDLAARQGGAAAPPVLLRVAQEAAVGSPLHLAALAAMGASWSPSYEPYVLSLLETAAEAVRLPALAALGASTDPTFADKLTRRIRQTSFGKLTRTEKAAWLMAVAQTGGAKAVPLLVSLLRWPRLLGGLDPEAQEAALTALARIDGPQAAEALQKELDGTKDGPRRLLLERLLREGPKRAAEPDLLALAASGQVGADEVMRARAVLQAASAAAGKQGLVEDSDLPSPEQLKILRSAKRAQALTHYELLGVRPTATAVQLDAALAVTLARFSNERYQGLRLGSMARYLERLRASVAEAHQVLADPAQRAAYDRSLRRR